MTWVCIFGSLIGIFSLYLLSFTLVTIECEPNDVNPSLVGRKLSLSGTCTEVDFHKNGHIFFSLSDSRNSVDVVIWEQKADELRYSGVNMSRFREGANLTITGYLERNKGMLQLVV